MEWHKLLSSQRQGKAGFSQLQRSEFEIDFDRIIFSLPFRRLQDKTQVFPLPEDDFVHNRLTHSLEVSSVGRSLGKLAGEQILAKHPELAKQFTASDFGAIVSAASLVHDVGNPPFGHSGENAISDFFKTATITDAIKPLLSVDEWADLVNFEGNAQGFRLINQSLHGLKLTYATLGAFSKYPRQALIKNKQKERVSQKKFGFYQSEKEAFKDLANHLDLISYETEAVWSRHPLAFLVEAADDICYHIIDLEDGCTLGLVTLEETIDLLKPIIGSRFDEAKLNAILSQQDKLGTLRAMAINELIDQTVKVFVENEEQLLDASFDTPLTSLIDSADAMKKIQSLSVDRIYRSKIVLEKEIAGLEVIEGLLDVLITAAYRHTEGLATNKDKTIIRFLPQEVIIYLQKGKLYNNLRVVLDFVSGMTDSHALTMYRKLKGMSLPSW
ncbi:MAG: deoxyguanosinetriphosphate triphosphohydrolase [Bacteroidetes bacterium]|nr:MAG: deoxyguanosinetriphosphate triphosphohydrolase [Bacteroidota bacterium]